MEGQGKALLFCSLSTLFNLGKNYGVPALVITVHFRQTYYWATRSSIRVGDISELPFPHVGEPAGRRMCK
jgi:hypothetical protein